MEPRKTNPTRNNEVEVRSLALLSGLWIRCCYELWRRSQTWLGSGVAVVQARPAAIAQIGSLAWEPPYAMGEVLSRQKTKKKKKKKLGTKVLKITINRKIQ